MKFETICYILLAMVVIGTPLVFSLFGDLILMIYIFIIPLTGTLLSVLTKEEDYTK